MKIFRNVLPLIIFLFAVSACTTPPPAEEEINSDINVIGLYPADNGKFTILVSKSVENPESYNYFDSLLFIQIDTAGHEIASHEISFENRPNIRNSHLLNDGNIMLFGNMNSESYSWFFSTQVYSPEGALMWEIDMADRTNGVAPAQNGDFFVFGWEESDTYYDNITYARMESDGDTLWSRIIKNDSTYATIRNGTPSSDDGCIAIGYIRIPNKGGDILVAKINSVGDTLWSGTYGGDRYDESQFVTELHDASILVVGSLNVYDSTNANWSLNSGEQIYLIKLSANGDKLWTKAVGNTLRETANALIETSDGSLVLCGTRDQSYAYLFDETTGWVSKLSASGEELWIEEFENKIPVAVRELPNGDLLVVTNNLQEDYWYQNSNDLNIMKLSSSGTLLWNKVLIP
jgi:hypothetical protein